MGLWNARREEADERSGLVRLSRPRTSILVGANDLAEGAAAEGPPCGRGDRVLDEVDGAVGEGDIHTAGVVAAGRGAAERGDVVASERDISVAVIRAVELVGRAEVVVRLPHQPTRYGPDPLLGTAAKTDGLVPGALEQA